MLQGGKGDLEWWPTGTDEKGSTTEGSAAKSRGKRVMGRRPERIGRSRKAEEKQRGRREGGGRLRAGRGGGERAGK